MLVAALMREIPATRDIVSRADLADFPIAGLRPPRTPTLARVYTRVGTALHGTPIGR
jgi:hypothetical protein